MDLRRSLLSLLMLLLLAALPGCSGSGSSGFDVSPGAENSAINQALDEQRCVDVSGLMICPAEQGSPALPTSTPTEAAPTATAAATTTIPAQPTATAVPPAVTATASVTPTVPTSTPTPTPTATNTPGMKVTFLSDTTSAVSCAVTDAVTCRFTVSFLVQGFSLGAEFRVAARPVDPTGPWSIGAPAVPGTALPADGFGAPASVSRQANQVQLVVLVFLHAPDFVPDQVELLGESGADLAFVANPITVE